IPKDGGRVLSPDTRRTIRGGAGHLSSTARADPRFSPLQPKYRIHQQRHTQLGRSGTGAGYGGRRLGSSDDTNERGISSRTPIYTGPLQNAAGHRGENWAERPRSAQGER